MHEETALNIILVHAGILPQWDLALSRSLAREVESILAGEQYNDLLANMYGNQPDCWADDLTGSDRLRTITNVFTRLRYCDKSGQMDFAEKGAPGSQRQGLLPWFEIPSAFAPEQVTVFGHWSTLKSGCYGKAIALDSGCLWGQQLTAVRLDEKPFRFFQVQCQQQLIPSGL